MKKSIFLGFLVLGVLLSFSFKEKINKKISVSISQINIDSSVRVGVSFYGTPHYTADCGVMLIKTIYTFKLTNTSKFKVRSKDGMIRIQFTCPHENGISFMMNNKTYYFYITPLKDTKEDWRTPEDNIPLYAFTGR